MSDITLSTDIYDIAATVEEIKSQYIDEDEDTLATDIFGYLGSVETRKIQSSILVASELSNECFPQRAKFKRNLISHAINLNITDINAVPARILFYLALRHEDIIDNLDENSAFIIDKEFSFDIAGYEFHPSYDVVLKRSTVDSTIGGENVEVFTAQYLIEHEDPNANINNPYLPTPLVSIINNEKYIAIPIQFSQMSYAKEYTTIITNGIIENKMTTFSFKDQLAYFEVIVNDKDYVTPVCEGSAIPDGVDNYCYYTYMDDTTIRVKFDRTSYTPKLNDKIKINVYTTLGSSGNFKYKDGNIITGNMSSDIYGYSNVDYELLPLSDALYGEDQKSKEELRKIIPKEALMKGIVSTSDDLNNYFNMVNTKDIVLRAQKKIDNQTERTFYTYFVMKDSENNVVPTNTLDLFINANDLNNIDLQEDTRLILPAGTVFGYNESKDRLYVYDSEYSDCNSIITEDTDDIVEVEDDDIIYDLIDSNYGDLNQPNNFVYISPFVISINKNPLYMQYYLTKINQDPYLDFKFINLNSPVSFIASTAHWERLFYTAKDKYTLSLSLSQNINTDIGIVETIPLVPDSSTVEYETHNLYEDYMNNKYYTKKDYDYNECYKLYYFSNINLNTQNTAITTQIPQDKSLYKTKIDETIGYGVKNSTSFCVYAMTEKGGLFYPAKIGTISITVSNSTTICKNDDGTYIDSTSRETNPVESETNGLVTIEKYYNTANQVYKYITYTAKVGALKHSVVDLDFINLMYDSGYMIYDKEIDIIYPFSESNETNKYDSLFYPTLVEAINVSVKSSGTYYVYTRIGVANDLLLLGTISVSKLSDSWAYNFTWKNYNYKYKDNEMNILNEYAISVYNYNVWDYNDKEFNKYHKNNFVYYNSLKEAVAHGRYESGDKYYVYVRTTVGNKHIEHPVYLGKINIKSETKDGFYTAKVGFISREDIYKYSYDDYKDYYYISDSILSTDTQSDLYSRSLFDAILSKKPSSGLWYVYTHNDNNTNPILMGTIKLNKTNDAYYACTYTWESKEEYEVIPHIKVLALFYKDNKPYRWANMIVNISDSNIDSFTYNFKTQLRSLEFNEATNAFDVNNNIFIDELYMPKTECELATGYFNPTSELEFYVFTELYEDGEIIQYPHIGGLNNDYPGLNPEIYFSESVVKGYTLCNIYKASGGVNFYENYADVMRSVVTPIESDEIDGVTAGYKITTVPVIGYRYSMDESHISEVVDAMSLRKAYIDNVMDELENTIGIDFKFFNTFGPSKTFTLSQNNDYIDRVNISLHFKVKLSEYNDEETVSRIKADVKEYIENLNYLEAEHISILITQINTDYANEIDYFDFTGFNNYDPLKLHIYRDDDNDIEIKTAPELLNVNNHFNNDTEKYEPDIYIDVIYPY